MKISLVLLLVLGFSAFAQAEDKSDGCGIGNMVWARQSLLATSIRNTTNQVIGVVNYVATTSGTLGCAKHSIIKNHKQDEHFMQANYSQVLIEASQGEGQYLTGLARTLGCNSSIEPEFRSKVKENFSEIFQKQDSSESLKKIHNLIESNQNLKLQCVKTA